MISGAGPIGLITLLACRAAGCAPIVLTDLVQSRLDFAKTLVPSVRTVLIDQSWSAERTAEEIRKAGGGELRTALECTGFEGSIRAAIYVSEGGVIW
jgi:L-iditol 2-dehydrogenase